MFVVLPLLVVVVSLFFVVVLVALLLLVAVLAIEHTLSQQVIAHRHITCLGVGDFDLLTVAADSAGSVRRSEVITSWAAFDTLCFINKFCSNCDSN